MKNGKPINGLTRIIQINIAPPGRHTILNFTQPAHETRTSYTLAALAVTVATLVAIPLEWLLSNANLVMLYVLAVMISGLMQGPRTAIIASLLSFLSFDFFLTEPRYTFHVTRKDELATLVFLLLIALACGPAASRIRRQFILLRDANRHSEAMRILGQELSIAEDGTAIKKAIHKVVTGTLQLECIVITNADQAAWPPQHPPLNSADRTALEYTRQSGNIAGRFSEQTSSSTWTVFPIGAERQCIACVLVKYPATTSSLEADDKTLIQAIAAQGADTWHRVELVSALEEARVTAEIEQLRSALLSSVSHDLKSPLAAMMGAAESLRLLDQQLQHNDRQELLDTILQESQRLDSYIQNLLDMTRLGYGTLQIERDWVSIVDIVASALTRLKRYHPEIKTQLQCPAEAPVLYVHAALVEQALFNILENAARFTPENEKISIHIITSDTHCNIEIEDRGPGIPAHLREKIFDMFFVVAEGDKKQQNTGMGLAICKGMIGAHGGRVSATEGCNNGGTKIVVELPLDLPPSYD